MMKRFQMPFKWTFIIIGVALLSAMNVTNVIADSSPEVGVHVGQRALDFTIPQLDGDPINLTEQIEKYDVVVLYFFYAAT